MSLKDDSFRMDFVFRRFSGDPSTGEFQAVLVPDPERYEWQEIDGEVRLYDKLDNVYFTENCLREGFKQLPGMPIYYQPHQVEEGQDYIRSRIPFVASMLDGADSPGVLSDKSGDFLEALAEQELGFVILSLDIVGSTELATTVEASEYATIIRVTLHELSEVVPKFHGHVLKYTGDGFIAYFAAPTVIGKSDLAIDCALTLHGLVYKALNPMLAERQMPTIEVRLGMDVDDARVEIIGSSATKRQADIISSVVSLATKIEGLADDGEICLGAALERNIHTMWRRMCEPIDLDESWPYTDSTGNCYAVYRIRIQPGEDPPGGRAR